ncbi:ISS1 [Scenedesmus sp. PABB004]|nr:ISS1 [Scenedesmus sp. PABB004]
MLASLVHRAAASSALAARRALHASAAAGKDKPLPDSCACAAQGQHALGGRPAPPRHPAVPPRRAARRAAPSSGELYGREDRDPAPSPNPSATQEKMSFPRDEAGPAGAKLEGVDDPAAYPNDPTLPGGAGPRVDGATKAALAGVREAEAESPKAAGQGVVEGLGAAQGDDAGADRGRQAAPCGRAAARQRRAALLPLAAQGGDAAPRLVLPQVSRRVLATDAPVIVKTKAMMARAPPGRPVLSLAQGIVHWQPPPAAAARAAELLAAGGPAVHGYGPADGLPALREALAAKLTSVNGLPGYEAMVTAGANQGFVNLVLSLCDASDRVVLFTPYYFNHLMALQMTDTGVLLGPSLPGSLRPDLDWLAGALAGPAPPKMVVITNPCNPTGVLLPREELERAAALCAAAGAWLVLDCTYEDFLYDGGTHHCVPGPNVLHLFSFSKCAGMMGWRVGYIAYPGAAAGGGGRLADEILKARRVCQQSARAADGPRAHTRPAARRRRPPRPAATAPAQVQDTIPICASQLSQHLALAALSGESRAYVAAQVAGLEGNRCAVADALVPLGRRGAGVAGGEGAIYYWAALPERFAAADEAAVAWLISEHGVCAIPGSACGAPGHLRVAFANLTPGACVEAAGRLRAGLEQLVGLDALPPAAAP